MVNYQNGKIYKIIDENNKIIYIGSTTQILSQRYQRHKYNAPNHKIILIENYSCNSKEELCMREQQIIEEHSDLLNQYRAYCSEEQKKEKAKEYYENNKEKVKEYYKEYYKDNKEKAKEYKKTNKEKIKEYNKEYYENNKDKIKEKNKNKSNSSKSSKSP